MGLHFLSDKTKEVNEMTDSDICNFSPYYVLGVIDSLIDKRKEELNNLKHIRKKIENKCKLWDKIQNDK